MKASFILACFVSVCLLLNTVNSQVRSSNYACCCDNNYRFNAPNSVTEECLYQHDYFSDQWTEEFNGYGSMTDVCATGCTCYPECSILSTLDPLYFDSWLFHTSWQDIYTIPGSSSNYASGCGNTMVVTRRWNFACNGVTGTLTQTINVVDTVSPELFVPPARVQECVSLDNVAGPDFFIGELDGFFGSARATDLCTNPTLTEGFQVNSDSPCNFAITRTFFASDQCNSASGSQSVAFVDTTPPVIFDNRGSVLYFTCDLTEGYTPVNNVQPLGARDACSNFAGTVTWVNDVVFPGKCAGDFSIERTWAATDTCNNVGYYVQTIIVEDPDPPIVYLGGNPGFGFDKYSEAFCTVPAPNNYVLVDNCDAPGATYLSFEETTTGVSEIESHYDVVRTYRATDDCGNYIEWQDVINVNKGGPQYTFSAQLPNVYTTKGVNIALGWTVLEISCVESYVAFDIGAADFVSITLPNCSNANGGLIYCPINPLQLTSFDFVTLTIFVPTTYAPNTLTVKQSSISSNPGDRYGFDNYSNTLLHFA